MTQAARYYLDDKNRFVIEDYNNAKIFTNFFPGVAGVWGIPMWVFYVNRGQCISSFGIESKDKAIMEFQPANKAYRYTSLHGFRTFIKIKKGAKTIFYEPFQDNLQNADFKISQRMAITGHDLTIEEVNQTLGLSVEVNYATLPEEQYAALIRRVTIKNTTKKPYEMEVVDGMPAIIPYGFNDGLLKHISRTVEAWVKVSNCENKAPYYNLEVIVSDKPYVENINEGNFYFAFEKDGGKPKLLDPIVQTSCVFGKAVDFNYPKAFLEKDFKVPKDQKTRNQTPCAMAHAKFKLVAGETRMITSLIGHIHSKAQLNRIVKRSVQGDYLKVKRQRSQEVLAEVQNYMMTHSACREFNLYAEQNFVDNVLRGGLPISLKTEKGNVVFNVFSRKHGDPERDYNYFVLSPTFLSQGNGNYRDVNQNRRNDIWFNRDLNERNVVSFFNLIQADGFNPLVVQGTAFRFSDPKKIDELVHAHVEDKDRQAVKDMLAKEFLPGLILKTIFEKDICLRTTPKDFLLKVLACCTASELADHGEGFWTDHWTYNLDLVESYLSVFPERLKEILCEKKIFTFYHSDHFVLSRDKRYILTDRGPRQYRSVAKLSAETLKAKKDNKLRAEDGQGDIYTTHLLAKCLCLIANKASSLDPSGIGIEMEADKPNWYDALNGLPGLLGSSISEAIELKRLCTFLLDSLDALGLDDAATFEIFEELHFFVSALADILQTERSPLGYWEKSNQAKEKYRSLVLKGINGAEFKISVGDIRKFLALVIEKTQMGMKAATDSKGCLTTYFYHEIVGYKKTGNKNEQDMPFLIPTEFKRHDLPLFLEGFVHALRAEKEKAKARILYQAVRRSNLFDKKLKMYRVNTDLSKETSEIGRARIFPAGWLENQSIWIHMEYKFLLELLRCGLYEEFYENIPHTLVPFLNPESYGRSILENSSFIVSSAHEDPAIHGRGYVARLSGSTAEFVHMWLVMSMGLKPFSLNAQGKLQLSFKPILSKDFFSTKEGSIRFLGKNGQWETVKLPADVYAFNFMNSTLVVYHNPKRLNTFDDKASVKKIFCTYAGGKKVEVVGSILPEDHAQQVRSGLAKRIDVFF